MIHKDTITMTIGNRFTFRERLKILVGHQPMTHVAIDVTAEYKDKKIALAASPGRLQTYLGKPNAPALPAPVGPQ